MFFRICLAVEYWPTRHTVAAHDAGRRHPVAATGARTGRGAQGEQARGTGAVRGRTLTVEHRPVRRRSYTLLVDLALLKSQHICHNYKQHTCPQKILPSTMSNAYGKETSSNIFVWLDFSCQTLPNTCFEVCSHFQCCPYCISFNNYPFSKTDVFSWGSSEMRFSQFITTRSDVQSPKIARTFKAH